jgi:hypothetical protein
VPNCPTIPVDGVEKMLCVNLDAPRALNESERLVVDHLLSKDFSEVELLRAQVNGAQVVGSCDCGCATVDLNVDASLPRTTTRYTDEIIPVAGHFGSSDRFGISVVVRAGALAMLRVWGLSPLPIRWPPPEQIELRVSSVI